MKNQKIYIIEDGEIVETDYNSHVLESAEETTTPKGVGLRKFVSELYIDIVHDDIDSSGFYVGENKLPVILFKNKDRSYPLNLDLIKNFEYNEGDYGITLYTVNDWGHSGSNLKTLDFFFTEEEAEERLWEFRLIEFENDDQRDTRFFHSKDEALDELN